MNFIKLTSYGTGSTLYYRADRIDCMCRIGEGESSAYTSIGFIDGHQTTVRETPEDIIDLIKLEEEGCRE